MKLRYYVAFLLLFTLGGTLEAANNNLAPKLLPGPGWNFTALCLQPSASNLTYAVYTQPLPAPAPHWEQQTIDPNYHFAFDLGLFYTLSSGVDQIKLDWLYLYAHDIDSCRANGSASVAPPYYFGPLAQALFHTSATGSVKLYLDNINLIVDHSFPVGRYLLFAPFGGAGFAYLKQSLTATYKGQNSTADLYSITAYNKSRFVGAGPRLGINAKAYATQGLSFMLEMAASLLVGKMNSTTNFTSEGRDNSTAVNTSLADQSATRTVPELDAKIAISYEHTFRCKRRIMLQLGYMFATYFNGINQVEPTSLVADQINNGVLAVETSALQQSDLGLNGPYIKFEYSF